MATTPLAELLRGLQPRLNAGVFVFASLPLDADLVALAPIATLREDEGLTVVLAESTARRAGLAVRFRAAWITLTVASELEAVGLTAAFAGALAQAGIACNVIAGVHHDHLFVPVAQADAAMAVLQKMADDHRQQA